MSDDPGRRVDGADVPHGDRDPVHPDSGMGHADPESGHADSDLGHAPPSVGPRATKLSLGVFFGACALLVVADFIVHRHMEHSLERVPAFYALYGFVGVAGLIMAAKGLRRIVMRGEDYYGAD